MLKKSVTGGGTSGSAAAVGALARRLDLEAMTRAREHKTLYGESLKYRIYESPGLRKGQKCPLVLLLHGAGERGSDNKAQMVHGVRGLIAFSMRNDQPMILVVPQCPARMQWVNAPWCVDSHTMPEFPSQPLRLAFELCKSVTENYPVDKSRIYVTGISMGGFGTWDAIQRKPEYFAAAMPVCGGGDTGRAKALIKLPIWVFHGDKDDVVKPFRSRSMVEAIKRAGGKPRYTECEDVGHDVWNQAYSDQKALAWLFSQKKQAARMNGMRI